MILLWTYNSSGGGVGVWSGETWDVGDMVFHK